MPTLPFLLVIMVVCNFLLLLIIIIFLIFFLQSCTSSGSTPISSSPLFLMFSFNSFWLPPYPLNNCLHNNLSDHLCHLFSFKPPIQVSLYFYNRGEKRGYRTRFFVVLVGYLWSLEKYLLLGLLKRTKLLGFLDYVILTGLGLIWGVVGSSCPSGGFLLHDSFSLDFPLPQNIYIYIYIYFPERTIPTIHTQYTMRKCYAYQYDVGPNKA